MIVNTKVEEKVSISPIAAFCFLLCYLRIALFSSISLCCLLFLCFLSLQMVFLQEGVLHSRCRNSHPSIYIWRIPSWTHGKIEMYSMLKKRAGQICYTDRMRGNKICSKQWMLEIAGRRESEFHLNMDYQYDIYSILFLIGSSYLHEKKTAGQGLEGCAD